LDQRGMPTSIIQLDYKGFPTLAQWWIYAGNPRLNDVGFKMFSTVDPTLDQRGLPTSKMQLDYKGFPTLAQWWIYGGIPLYTRSIVIRQQIAQEANTILFTHPVRPHDLDSALCQKLLNQEFFDSWLFLYLFNSSQIRM
jgi:hypothetical protein